MGSGNEAGFPFEPGTKADDGWYTKVQRLDARVFQGVLAILMSIILIFPLGIPVGVEPFVLEVAEWIESLEAGDVIWLSQHYSVGSVTDYGALYTSLLLHILLRSGELKAEGNDVNGDGIADGLKLLCVPVSIDGLILFQWQIGDRIWEYIPDNIVYGEDYVLFPMIALSDALYDRYADEGFQSVYDTDFGLPEKGIGVSNYEDLPVLLNVVDPEDIDCNIGEDATTSARIWARYGDVRIDHSPNMWTKYSQTGRRRPHAAAYPVQVWDSAAQAVAMPYYTAGLYSGFFNGVRNGGEYEIWLNDNKFIKNDPALGAVPLNHGFGGQTLDAVNLAMAWTWIMMLVANIGWFVERRSKGGA
jgi:hypothetical protein